MSERLAASFRDPSGFMFRRDGTLYRQINTCYAQHYDAFMNSGLYADLMNADLLVAHHEVCSDLAATTDAYKVIQPEVISFISYPYEWCFGQLKAAALATLDIARRALDCGMVLKDASAYNVQFRGCQPTFIDTLSFETYTPGAPWVAYRQFCQHFLAPLALMSYVDVRLNSLLRTHIDGVPLDLAARMLPKRTYLTPSLLLHIHLHAKSQARYADAKVSVAHVSSGRFTKRAFEGLLTSLKSAVSGLAWQPKGTEWGDYYSDTNYTDGAMQAKMELVEQYIQAVAPKSVWDLGASTGHFSRAASSRGIPTVAFDIDAAAVEKNYRQGIARKDKSLLPLLLDLTNPTPALGWHHAERTSLAQRGPADLVMALALVHHLAIGNNTPLGNIAAFLADIGHSLMIEFVPKTDSQVQRLLASRKDIFDTYTQEEFERAFSKHFEIKNTNPIPGSQRVLYLMTKKQTQ